MEPSELTFPDLVFHDPPRRDRVRFTVFPAVLDLGAGKVNNVVNNDVRGEEVGGRLFARHEITSCLKMARPKGGLDVCQVPGVLLSMDATCVAIF